VLRIRIEFNEESSFFYLNVGLDQINADPQPDRGQTLPSKKLDFDMKNILYVGICHKHTYAGTTAILKGWK
jgi:hypothetical protein